MNWNISPEDKLFLRRIESCDFPVADFGHQAHLRLAYIYLADSTPYEALQIMERSLRKLLDFNGVDAKKFHVTLTRAWIFAVRHFMERVPDCPSSAAFLASAPQLLDPAVMETHYSPELLYSETARKSVVQADRDPIPEPT